MPKFQFTLALTGQVEAANDAALKTWIMRNVSMTLDMQAVIVDSRLGIQQLDGVVAAKPGDVESLKHGVIRP